MKKLLLILIALTISLIGWCQEKSNGGINLTFSIGSNDVNRFLILTGGSTYEGEGFIEFDITYLKILNNRWDLEVGLGYSDHKLVRTPEYAPGKDMTTQKGTTELLSLPVAFNYKFWRYVYLNAGVTLDYEINGNLIDNQSGMGVLAGLGFSYNFLDKYSAFINPYLKQHSIISFNKVENKQMLSISGIKIGLGMQF